MNIEIVAALFGFFAVVLTILRSVLCWPIGLVQVILYIHVFYEAKLYSDMLLHFAFAILQFYGWLHWHRGHVTFAVQVKSLYIRGWLISIGSCATFTAAIGGAMWMWTDAALPWADAFIAAASLVAQYQLAHKYLQNWYFWIVVDMIAIAVFSSRELWPTVLLYILFLILAIIGAVVWHARFHATTGVDL